MELINIEQSQLVFLFTVSQPNGYPPIYHLIEMLGRRYNFASIPKQLEEVRESVTFQHGAFGNFGIDTFSIHSDGVVVRARSNTRTLDEFVEDVHQWVKSEYGHDIIKSQNVDKSYESHVTVRIGAPIMKLLEAFAPVNAAISKILKESTDLDVLYQPVSISLGADSSEIPGMKPALFRFERKFGVPFGSNLYYSAAPLRTDDHLKVLQKLAKLL